MNLFEEELEVLEEDSELTEEQQLLEWGVNFETGQLTGRLVEGTEAVKVWAWNALKTTRYRYIIYSWFYGNDFNDVIGEHYSEEYVETEIYSMIEECLLVSPHILEVTDISFVIEEEQLTIQCKLITDFGEVELDV